MKAGRPLRSLLSGIALFVLASGCHRADWGGPGSTEASAPSTHWPPAGASVPASSDSAAPVAAPLAVVPAPKGSAPRLLLTEPLLAELARRAQARSAEWTALKARCDALLPGKVEWPEGSDYADLPNVGEGYQGDGYYHPLLALGLCHRIAQIAAPGSATAYATKGIDILRHMSALDGPHAVDPLRDSGFGIRFFGVGMALGYDWMRDALSPDDKKALVKAMKRWLDAYETKGFAHNHPQGNYFAGYYAAKALFALATEGDAPEGAAAWADFRDRVHGKMVQPYYAKYVKGGGWPEGWHYGSLATFNMCLPALAARSAKGIDLVGDAKAPFSFPVDQGSAILYATWPNERTLDDRGAQKAGKNPSAAEPWLFTAMSGILETFGAEVAPAFHKMAREVRTSEGAKKIEPWQAMLFWNPAAKEADYRKLPLSYATPHGMQTAFLRSTWEPSAVWSSFTSGAYVNNPDSGEMSYDQGALVIVRGGSPFLVNAAAAIKRHSPGTEDGDKHDDDLYADEYGSNDKNPELGNRALSNVFYAKVQHYGQVSRMPTEGPATRLAAYEEGVSYALVRGEHLEDMYRPAPDGHPPVASWTRQVVFLRPGVFVVDDRTTVTAAATDQWLAFHMCGAPAASVTAQGRGLERDVSCGSSFGGTFTSLLPRTSKVDVVDLFGAKKVFRAEVRSGSTEKTVRWLTVLESASSRADAAAVTRLSKEDGNVTNGAVGALLRRASSADVALSAPSGHEETRYDTPLLPGLHVVSGLDPRGSYGVTLSASANGRSVTVKPGGSLVASGEGVLAFRVTTQGGIGPSR